MGAAGGSAYVVVYVCASIGLVEPGGAYIKDDVCAPHEILCRAPLNINCPLPVGGQRGPLPALSLAGADPVRGSTLPMIFIRMGEPPGPWTLRMA